MLMGSRIRKEREKLHLSQEQLGDMIGVSKVSICGYEQENRIPSLPVFLDLAEVLKVDTNYLLGHDVTAISEDAEMVVKLCREDLKIINEIKKNRKLYNALLEDSPRTIKLINRKLYD